MRLTVQTAKYILVPIILAIFIMYTGLIVYQYIVQTPAISMSLANNPIPFPLFQFSFPYGEEVRMAQNLQQLSAPGVPGSIWTGGPVYMPDSSTNQVAPVSAYFTTTNRSFASVGPARPPRFNATTTYIFDPKGRRWPPSVHLSLGISPSQLIGSDSIPVLRPFIKFQVRGSRFTHDRDFGALMNLDLGQFPPDHNPFADPVRVSVTRDVNSDIQDGLWGQSSTYAVKAYQYKYLNGSNEYFYEVSSVGRIMLPPPSNYITIDIRLATQYLTIYEETQLITKAQSIGAIASAFQILLLTGLIFLFGNGKYSPYGLIHRLLPNTAVPQYAPVGDDEMSRFRYFVNEYLDTTPLGAPISSSKKGPLPVSAISILAMLFSVTSLVLYLVALFGGNRDIFARSINFLVIGNASIPAETRTELGLGLWGFCRITQSTYDCRPVPMSELFSSFQFNATLPSTDAYVDKTNPVGFTLLLGSTIFIAIAFLSRGVSFWLRSLSGSSDVVAPSTALVSTLTGTVAFISLVLYYKAIGRNVEAWGGGWQAHLGPAVAVVGAACVINAAAAGTLLWELAIRHKMRDEREWQRPAYLQSNPDMANPS